ncbi:MAG: hypothetical protein CMC97_06215 [Flavobacteriales bacterium]|nr:hypothetical protein [Flavobacteriales bacterium]
MSKWVAKKDDVDAPVVQNTKLERAERPAGGGARDAAVGDRQRNHLEARRQADQARRQIRLAAQEARGTAGDARGRKQLAVGDSTLGSAPPLAPTVEALLTSARSAQLEDWGDDQYWANVTWDGHVGAGRSDWKQDAWNQDEWRQPKDWMGYAIAPQGETSWKRPESDGGWKVPDTSDEWSAAEDWNASWHEGPADWDEPTEDPWGDNGGSDWDEFITVRDQIVRVDLSGLDLGDADLKALMRHLDGFMRRYVESTHGVYSLNMDLSCNSYITDLGVANHLCSFLHRWPICHRLKLYKNAIGDHSIKALSSWVAEGYAHELHLSDLSGHLTADGVFHLFREIAKKGCYPYQNGTRTRCALWLRLEHNGVVGIEDLMKRARTQLPSLALCVLDRADLARIRPGTPNTMPGGKEVPAVNLVLFRLQDRTQKRSRVKARPGMAQVDDEGPSVAVVAEPAVAHALGGDIKELWEPQVEAKKPKAAAPPKPSVAVGAAPTASAAPGGDLHELWEPPVETKKAKTAGQAKKLDATQLVMGCASYRSNPRALASGERGPVGGGPAGTAAVAAAGSRRGQRQLDIGSSAAFPSLGGSGDPCSVGGMWGAPPTAVAAWGSAPPSVFTTRARPEPRQAPRLPAPPSKDWPAPAPVPSEREAANLPSATQPLEVQAAPVVMSPAPLPAPVTVSVVEAPAPEVLRPASPEVVGDFSAQPQEDEWRPLSFAEKNILKVHKKLREISKIKEAHEAGAPLEKNQVAKVQQRPKLEQELAGLEERSRAQGGRTLQELERAERWRRDREERDKAAVAIQRVFRGHTDRLFVRLQTRSAADEVSVQKAARIAAAGSDAVMQEPEQAIAMEAEEQNHEVEDEDEDENINVTSAPVEKVEPPQCDRWWYKTPAGDVHGPFETTRMRQWHENRYFKHELPVKLDWYKDFYPLGSLYGQNWADAFTTSPAHPPVEQPLEAGLEALVGLQSPVVMPSEVQQPQSTQHKALQQQPVPPKTREMPQHTSMQPCVVVEQHPDSRPDSRSDSHRSPPDQASVATLQPLSHGELRLQQSVGPPRQPPVRPPQQPPVGSQPPPSAGQPQQPPTCPPQQPPVGPPQQPPAGQQRHLSAPSQAHLAAHTDTPTQAIDLGPQRRVSPSSGQPQPHSGPPQQPAEPPRQPPARPPLLPPGTRLAPQPAPVPETAVASPEGQRPVDAEVLREAEVVEAPPRSRSPAASVAPTPEVSPHIAQMGQEPPAQAGDSEASAFSMFLKRAGKTAVPEAGPPLPVEPQRRCEPPGSVAAMAPEPPPPRPSSPGSIREDGEAQPPGEVQSALPLSSDAAQMPTASATMQASALAPLGFGLPPPGTVTRKGPSVDGSHSTAAGNTGENSTGGSGNRFSSLREPVRESGKEQEVVNEEDEGERVHEVSPLEHRFVGLVIGKAGETIKSFKKQSGASIEIDQNLPDGLPRAVIYKGTRRQVNVARKLVESIVQRAKDDEKAKNQNTSGGGMGILGRGPAGEAKGGDDGREPPPWRRARVEDELKSRADVGSWKKGSDYEAAKWGSLTSADVTLGSMRPAWMKPGGAKASEDAAKEGSADDTVLEEQKYSRGLLVFARHKILRSKAYEVPFEMMTMTTGPRPREAKVDKKKVTPEGDVPAPRDDTTAPRLELAERSPSPPQSEREEAPASALHEAPESREAHEVCLPKVTLYESLPGDSKDILKLKKKLREIQKIEEALSGGEKLEPNQREKVLKKVVYEDELRQLEAIVRPNGRPIDP